MPERLINSRVHTYWGMVDKQQPQTAVYIHGQDLPPGLEGGMPAWIPVDFPAVPAFDTQDTVVNLPRDFSMLSVLAFSSQAASAAFAVLDVVSGRWIVDKLGDARLFAGSTGYALIDRVPHNFDDPATNPQEKEPQLFIRVVNQAAAQAEIQVAFFGIVGGVKD